MEKKITGERDHDLPLLITPLPGPAAKKVLAEDEAYKHGRAREPLPEVSAAAKKALEQAGAR